MNERTTRTLHYHNSRGTKLAISLTSRAETLRVDLGEEPKARFRDIFAPAQLLRAEGDSAPR